MYMMCCVYMYVNVHDVLCVHVNVHDVLRVHIHDVVCVYDMTYLCCSPGTSSQMH